MLETNLPRIRGLIASLVADKSAIDDLVQETSLTIWNKRALFEPGTNFIAWAFRIARFKVMSHGEKRRRLHQVEFDDALIETLAEEAVQIFDESEDRKHALALCFGTLREEDQRLLSVLYDRNASLAEYSRIKGRSENSLHQKVSRLRKLLRRCVESKLDKE